MTSNLIPTDTQTDIHRQTDTHTHTHRQTDRQTDRQTILDYYLVPWTVLDTLSNEVFRVDGEKP